jgi:hypothetical protein
MRSKLRRTDIGQNKRERQTIENKKLHILTKD